MRDELELWLAYTLFALAISGAVYVGYRTLEWAAWT